MTETGRLSLPLQNAPLHSVTRMPHQVRLSEKSSPAGLVARRLLLIFSVMRRELPSWQAPSVVIIASLLTIFLLGLATTGSHSAVAMAAETECTEECDSTVLVGMAGSTLSLLAREALGVLKIGAGTTATLVLAVARNLGGIGLWLNVAYLAMTTLMALVAATAFLLAIVYTRKDRRS